MIEIQTRAGTGGKDAQLLAKDLMDVYLKVSSKFNLNVVDFQETNSSFSLYL